MGVYISALEHNKILEYCYTRMTLQHVGHALCLEWGNIYLINRHKRQLTFDSKSSDTLLRLINRNYKNT